MISQEYSLIGPSRKSSAQSSVTIQLSDPRKRWAAVIFRWWAWEIMAALVSIIAFLALISLLISNDERPNQPWRIGDTQLTVNTIVAIVSTIMRTSLGVAVAGALAQCSWNEFADPRQKSAQRLEVLEVIGEAQYSASGSLRLLFGRLPNHLASLGAIVTILSLAFDAFSQQVLMLDTVGLPGISSDDGALLPRLTSFNDTVTIVGLGTSSNSFNFPSLGAQQAFLGGALADDNFQPAVSCATGNCSWPETPTLAVCGSCIDASSSLVSSNDGNSLVFNMGNWVDQHSVSGLAFDNSSATQFIFTLEADWVDFSQTADIEAFKTSPYIAHFRAYGISPQNFDPATFYANGQNFPAMPRNLMVAYNCSLNVCLQSLNGTASNGIIQETVVQTSNNFQGTYSYGNGTNMTDNHAYNSTYLSFKNPMTHLDVPDDTTYTIDTNLVDSFGVMLFNAFTGNVTTVQWDDGTNTTMYITPNTTDDGIVPIQGIWQASNTTGTMNDFVGRVSNALTVYLRNHHAAPADQRYAPTMYNETVVTVVRWEWLIFPLTLMLSGLFFLIAVIFQTRRRPVLPWKGRRMPVLLANVDPFVRDTALAAGGLRHRYYPRHTGGDVRVRVEYDGSNSIAFSRDERRLSKS